VFFILTAGGGRIGDRAGDSVVRVPQRASINDRELDELKGLNLPMAATISPELLVTVALAPLVAR